MNKLFLIAVFVFALPISALAKGDLAFHQPGECGCKPYIDNTWYAYYWDGDSWDYVGGPYNQLSECIKDTKTDVDLKEICKR